MEDKKLETLKIKMEGFRTGMKILLDQKREKEITEKEYIEKFYYEIKLHLAESERLREEIRKEYGIYV